MADILLTFALGGALVLAPIAAGAATESGLEAAVRARGLDPVEVLGPVRLTAAIRTWLGERVATRGEPEEVLQSLLTVLVGEEGLGLGYRPGFTGTPAEVFDRREANCLAFTQLFVAAARELGIDAYYMAYEIPERYTRQGDLVVLSSHVTAGYGPPGGRQVLDFGAVLGFDARLARPIEDLEALARYYANRGAELLQEGEIDAGREMAEVAAGLEPGLPDGWVNLGVARRRGGDLDGAERAYRRAIDADPGHLPAYHNLSTLLRLRGERRLARQMLRLLDRKGNRSPYIYLDLGDLSLDEGQADEAERYYRRAWQLARDLAETRAARGLAALARGDERRARKWLERARRKDAGDARTLELAARLGERGGQGS